MPYEQYMEQWHDEESAIIGEAKQWITDWLKDNKYDSMYLAYDNGVGGRATDALIVLNENQVKSADPVTYDDKGKVIPLSERFNSENNDIRYSIDPELKSKLQAIENNTYNTDGNHWENDIYIGETSNFLTDVIGTKSLPVYMRQIKAYADMVSKEKAKADYEKNPDKAYKYDAEEKNLHYHALGHELLLEALSASETPVVAFADFPDASGNERLNRIVLVTDKQKDGNNIIVVTEIESTARKGGRKVAANKDITVFDNELLANNIARAIKENRILAVDKKRAQNLTGRIGAISLTAMTDSELNSNIADFWGKIKIKNSNSTNSQKKTSNGMTAMEVAMQNAGKIRHKDDKHSFDDTLDKQGVTGNSGTIHPVNTGDRVKVNIPFHYAIVPYSSLIMSHDASGNVNPDYDQTLQPRNRATKAYRDEAIERAQMLEPDVMMESKDGTTGAPFVRPDGTVISGNGRMISQGIAYTDDLYKKSGVRYRDYLLQNAGRFGIDSADIMHMENPVLVRVGEGDLNWKELASQMNDSIVRILIFGIVLTSRRVRLITFRLSTMKMEVQRVYLISVKMIWLQLRKLLTTIGLRWEIIKQNPHSSVQSTVNGEHWIQIRR